MLVAATLAFFAFMMVVCMLNLLTTGLAVVAAVIAAIYPFTKRFLAIPQAWLGLCFSVGIPMGFAAQTGDVPALAWWLVAANFFWVLAYDTEYAMVDRDDDLRIGIKTSAILFGRFDVLAVALCYGAFFAMMAGIGAWQGYGPFYFTGLLAGGIVAGYHLHWIKRPLARGLLPRVPAQPLGRARCLLGITPSHYTIKAHADPVPYEYNTKDNTTTYTGTITIKILGDTNNDNTVDNTDLTQLKTAYGTKPGDPSWNPECDFNRDNLVNVNDFRILGKNFRKEL